MLLYGEPKLTYSLKSIVKKQTTPLTISVLIIFSIFKKKNYTFAVLNASETLTWRKLNLKSCIYVFSVNAFNIAEEEEEELSRF